MTRCTKALHAMTALAALTLPSAPAVSQVQAAGSPIGQAFCEREPFALAAPSEVPPFLDYLALLRSGGAEPPSPDCPNTTVRELFAVLSAPSLEEGLPLRDAFLGRYVQRAEGLSMDARYLSDAELASFLWLFCSGGERESCVEDLIEGLPKGFTASSPVFCDFAPVPAIEPVTQEPWPLLCSGKAVPASRERWHEEMGNYAFG